MTEEMTQRIVKQVMDIDPTVEVVCSVGDFEDWKNH